ncbi:transcriptional repressor [[Clostridium] dakarense]|uniref:transcriptional repressor n=1 Tax=Faecalimicrobium dakarense TaxID=1301100 RepID=UPI0004B1BECB|nr:transcriptional repressor [[Clostridium] dakarense]
MGYCFHKMNKHILQFDPNINYQKVKFNHYVMRKVNLNNMKGELPNGQFKISMRSAASDLDISVSTVYNLLKSFEVLNIVKLIRKGGKDHSYSIYKYITDEENQKTVVKTVIKNDIKTVQYSDINNQEGVYETLDKTHTKIDSETSNIENINKDIKIYTRVIDYLNKKLIRILDQILIKLCLV